MALIKLLQQGSRCKTPCQACGANSVQIELFCTHLCVGLSADDKCKLVNRDVAQCLTCR